MLRKVRKYSALLLALTMIFVLALGAGAAYVKTPTKADVDGTVVGSITDNEVTVSVEITPGSAKSVNFYLDGDALSSEFWNNSGAYVEVDVTMHTDGDQVYACMPGFTANWGWVNPTDWNGLLVNGQATTVREPFSTYYSGGFSSKEPMALRVQLYTNSSETQNVEVTVSGLRFVGVGDAPEVTTVATTTTSEPEETTTAPVEEETEAPVEDDEPVDEPEDTDAPADTEDEPEETTTAATTTAKTEEEDTDRPITTTTQPNQATTPAATTAATTTGASDIGGDSFAGPIVIIVIVVVVIAAAAVGFIIYRKKKFY